MTTPNTNLAPAAAASAGKPNGAPAAAPAAAPQSAPELEQLRREAAEWRQKAEAADKKMRVNSIEMMKFRDEKKGLGAKLTEHSQFDAAFKAAGLSPAELRSFKVNPQPVLQKVFGEKWYDAIVEMKLNGGAPTADAVAAEIARAKEEAIAEVRREREEQESNARKQQQEREAQAREQLATEAGAFLEKSGGDYPIFEGLPVAQVARAIAQHIENEYHRTGKVLTSKEACDALESAEISRAERLAGIEKYRGKLTEKLKPANTSPVVGARSAGSTQSEQRRTQPNDPTQKRSFRTDEERRAAIMAMKLPGE